MPLRNFAALVVAGCAVIGLGAGVIAQDVAVDPAIASMSPEELVEARQEAMKEDGGILRGAGGLSGADAVAAADVLIQNFTNFPALFAEGSIVGDSKALPIIWEEKEAFDAIFAQAVEISTGMKAAAEAGDTAGFAAGAQELGGLCGMCHQKYRS
jgi:cytochrome c556